MPFVCYATMQQHNHHKKFSKNKGKNRKTFQNPIHCCQTNTHFFSGREGNTVALFVTKRKNWVMLWVWILIPEIVTWLACVASVSARVRQEHWDESNKEKVKTTINFAPRMYFSLLLQFLKCPEWLCLWFVFIVLFLFYCHMVLFLAFQLFVNHTQLQGSVDLWNIVNDIPF